MEKASSILFSLFCLFILLGSPSSMVMGQGKACESVKDCYTLFCKRIHLVCLEGHCICNEAPKYMERGGSLSVNN
ncbi:hypothetical protein P3S67_015126 [Capsicum chacoense]